MYDDKIIEINRFGNYNKLLRTHARVLIVCRSRSLLEMSKNINADDIHEAFDYWIKLVPKNVPSDQQLLKMERL